MNIAKVYKFSKIKRHLDNNIDMELMKDANDKFNSLRKCINGEVAG